MWHEARKHEKHIRSMMVDYRRRAERRQDFYARIKQDPIKFLRVYGIPAKINLDADIVKAAENSKAMMPWTADPSVTIDRFDARANLEFLPENSSAEIKMSTLEKIEERLCNYERYRCLVHNDFLGVSEEMILKQIEIEERFGDPEERRKKEEEDEKMKKQKEGKAAIGFTYDENEPSVEVKENVSGTADPESPDSECEADSDMDIDVELDLSILTGDQRRLLAKNSSNYGLKSSDFIRLLDADQQLEVELRLAKVMEEEKSHLVRRPRGRHFRIRRDGDRLAKPFGPKIGLLNGQPITRRKIYLSGASSDSQNYDSASSVDIFESSEGQSRQFRATPTTHPMNTKPNLFESKRPAVPIGGLTLVSFCNPRRNARRLTGALKLNNVDNPDESDGTSSSDSISSHRHCRYPRKIPKRSKVEYITTFGGDDDDADDFKKTIVPHTPLQHSRLPQSSSTAALASSVVSSLYKSNRLYQASNRSPVLSKYSPLEKKIISVDSVNSETFRIRGSVTSRRRQSPLASSKMRNLRCASKTSSSSSKSRSPPSRQPYHRTGSSSRDSQRFRRRRRSSSSVSGNRRRPKSPGRRSRVHAQDNSSRTDPQREFRNRSRSHESQQNKDLEPSIPVKRYYRPELELEEENNKFSDSGSSSGENLRKQKESFGFIGPSGRWRNSEMLGDGDTSFGSGGKKSIDDSKIDGYDQNGDKYSGLSHISSSQAVSSSSKDSYSRNPPVSSTTSSSMKFTPKELLKRRMQAQLNRAVSADKKAEQERQLKLEKERQEREENMRKLASKLRQRELERRREERRLVDKQIKSLRGHHSGSSNSSVETTSRSCSPPSPPSSARDPIRRREDTSVSRELREPGRNRFRSSPKDSHSSQSRQKADEPIRQRESDRQGVSSSSSAFRGSPVRPERLHSRTISPRRSRFDRSSDFSNTRNR